MNIKRLLLVIMCLSLGAFSCERRNENLLGKDIRLFKGPAWELAQAVEKEDTMAIKKIINERNIPVDYQESKFGETLLLWSVWTNHYASSKILLENGADPNRPDYYNGISPFIYAADKFETSIYVQLLLKYKGNPNAVTKNDSTNMLCTPLISAAYNRLESVKLLVDAGANINYVSKNFRCALGAAFTFKKVV